MGSPVLCGCIVSDADKDSARANSAGPGSSETCDGIEKVIAFRNTGLLNS